MVKKLFYVLAISFFTICLSLFIAPNETSASVTGYVPSYTYGASYNTYVAKRDPVFKDVFSEYIEEYKDACWFCDLFAGKAGTTYENKTGITEDEAQKQYDPYQNPDLSADEMKKHNEETTAANWNKKTTYSGGVYDAINVITRNMFNEMAQDFLTLLGIGILFYILLKVGKLLVQFQEVDVMQFLNDLFKPLGRAIIAVAILGVSVSAGHQTIFYMLTNPVFDASIRMGEKILETTLGSVKILKTGQDIDSKLEENLTSNIKWDELNTKAEAENSQQGGDNPLEEAPRLALIQWMKSVSSSFIVGIALGGSFVATGLSNFFSKGGLSMTAAGAIIWLGFWLIYLMFPLKIIDAFVRLAFVFALMPLWVILWVFPITQQYTKKAWEMFLSSCLLFVILSIMIALTLILVSNIVPSTLYSEAGSISRSDFFKLLCSDDKMKEALEYAGFGSGLCLNAIAYTAMSFSLLSAAASIANSFVGGGGGVQTNVGDGVASTATQVGRVGWSATRAVGQTAALAGSKAHDMWTNRGSRHTPTGTFRGTSSNGGAGGNNNSAGSASTTGGGNPPSSYPQIPDTGTTQNGTQTPEMGTPYDPSKPAFEQLSTQSQRDVGNKTRQQQRALHIAVLRDNPTERQRIMDSAGPEERRALENMEAAMRDPTVKDYVPQFTALREAISRDILTRQNSDATRRSATGTEGDAHRTGTPDTSATDRAGASADVANMTPERAKAVQELSKDATAPQKFEKLSADVAFVEQSLSTARGRDEFMQAIQNHHDWQSGDSKTMVSFAERMYDANKNGNDVQARHIVKELLSPHLDNTTAGWNTNGQISAKVETAVKAGGPGHVLSDQLHALSLQITAAQTARPEE